MTSGCVELTIERCGFCRNGQICDRRGMLLIPARSEEIPRHPSQMHATRGVDSTSCSAAHSVRPFRNSLPDRPHHPNTLPVQRNSIRAYASGRLPESHSEKHFAIRMQSVSAALVG
jgi:hypothetical protein